MLVLYITDLRSLASRFERISVAHFVDYAVQVHSRPTFLAAFTYAVPGQRQDCELTSALGLRRRGCRAGRHVRSRDRVYKQTTDRSADVGDRIPTVVGLRPTPRRLLDHADGRRRVLQTVRRTSSLPVKVGVFNARQQIRQHRQLDR